MKKTLLISVFIILLGLANAQELSKSQIDLDIQKLAELKVEYEKHRGNDKKGDSVFSLYKEQINKIKKSPKIYLRYINCTLRNNNAQIKERILSI